MTPAWILERLGKHHDRAPFDCGNDRLNEWLAERAGQFDRRDLARTYVAVRPGEAVVVGYYAVSSHAVRYDALPTDQAKGLPHIDVPVVLLGRFAVDRSEQGKGLGGFLLVDALRRAQHLAEHVGVRAVEVDAIDDAARKFYSGHGFIALKDDPHHLFLPMTVIRKLRLPPLA
ncbi:MAG: GNAT family N-acetyltransferase [Gemmataceae bacterium]|nr:GNAT family N-acetyltransferase [Gemmataceae bacterium]